MSFKVVEAARPCTCRGCKKGIERGEKVLRSEPGLRNCKIVIICKDCAVKARDIINEKVL